MLRELFQATGVPIRTIKGIFNGNVASAALSKTQTPLVTAATLPHVSISG
jgi:hypothetical protein